MIKLHSLFIFSCLGYIGETYVIMVKDCQFGVSQVNYSDSDHCHYLFMFQMTCTKKERKMGCVSLPERTELPEWTFICGFECFGLSTSSLFMYVT